MALGQNFVTGKEASGFAAARSRLVGPALPALPAGWGWLVGPLFYAQCATLGGNLVKPRGAEPDLQSLAVSGRLSPEYFYQRTYLSGARWAFLSLFTLLHLRRVCGERTGYTPTAHQVSPMSAISTTYRSSSRAQSNIKQNQNLKTHIPTPPQKCTSTYTQGTHTILSESPHWM